MPRLPAKPKPLRRGTLPLPKHRSRTLVLLRAPRNLLVYRRELLFVLALRNARGLGEEPAVLGRIQSPALPSGFSPNPPAFAGPAPSPPVSPASLERTLPGPGRMNLDRRASRARARIGWGPLPGGVGGRPGARAGRQPPSLPDGLSEIQSPPGGRQGQKPVPEPLLPEPQSVGSQAAMRTLSNCTP